MDRATKSFFDDIAANYVVIPKPRFIQEHTNLLKVLTKKNPGELEKEKADQKKELMAMLKSKKPK